MCATILTTLQAVNREYFAHCAQPKNIFPKNQKFKFLQNRPKFSFSSPKTKSEFAKKFENPGKIENVSQCAKVLWLIASEMCQKYGKNEMYVST